MKEEGIRVFLKVVEAGTISGAAEELFTTQSNVSKQVRALEAELGVSLLYRHKGKRHIELTGYGERFLHVARKWASLEKEFEDIPNADIRTEISIGATDIINVFTLSGFYKKFIKKHPEIRLDIHTHHSNELYDLMERNRLDLALAGILLPAVDIAIRPLYREEMYVLRAGKNHAGNIIKPAELVGEREVYAKWSQEYERWHDMIWPGQHYSIHCGTATMIADYLDEPDAWAIVPASCIDHFTERLNVQPHQLSIRPPDKTYYLLRQQNMRESRTSAVKTFEKELSAELEHNNGIEMIKKEAYQ